MTSVFIDFDLEPGCFHKPPEALGNIHVIVNNPFPSSGSKDMDLTNMNISVQKKQTFWATGLDLGHRDQGCIHKPPYGGDY